MPSKKKYDIIYADPPWKYSNARGTGAAEKHYRTMTEKEIRQFGANEIRTRTNEDCALLLWATGPKMATAMRIMRSWGFHFKNVFAVWVKTSKKSNKPTIGKGYYTRANAEFCLLGIKGKGSHLRSEDTSKAISQIVYEPKREHSRKPDTVREMIDKVFKEDLQKIEVFAREKFENWDQIGDETNKFYSMSEDSRSPT